MQLQATEAGDAGATTNITQLLNAAALDLKQRQVRVACGGRGAVLAA